MSFFGLSIGTIALWAAVAVLTVALWRLWRSLRRTRRTLEAFLRGKDGACLEEVLLEQGRKLTEVDGELEGLYGALGATRSLARRGVNRVGLLRFNPFKDLGGDQSFALALLDSHGDGVVISSLHTQEATRIYAKPIKAGRASKYPLSAEERKAVEKALTRAEKKKAV